MAIPSPNSTDRDLSVCKIFSNGVMIPATCQVLSLHVVNSANQIPTAKMVILDGSPATQEFPLSDSTTFAPGVEIAIELGYSDSTLARVFAGIIVKHGLRIDPQRGSVLVVECFDKAVKMTIGRKHQYFEAQSDSTVISSILAAHGLAAVVTGTPSQAGPICQYDCTDWDFILMRAQANGMVVVTDGGKVTVAPPDLSRTPVWQVAYGESILALNLDMDVRTQMAAVQCSSWDAKSDQLMSVSALPKNINALGCDTSSALAKVTGTGGLQLETAAPFTKELLAGWAAAVMLQSELAKVTGVIQFQGAKISPGEMLQTAGLGKRFNGNGYVGSVQHRLENGQWTTEATLGIKPEWLFSPSQPGHQAAAVKLPPVSGLQTGLVKQIDQDPEGSFRMLVEVPFLHSPAKGIWARLAKDYATNAAGLFFYPEIGDEVILGFMNGNAQCPVILGSLHGGRRPPPNTPDQPNSIKSIVTNSKLRLEFDEAKKVLKLQTPGGNSLVLSDDGKNISLTDQNGNFLKMSSSGIELSSAKDITIRAAQNISVTATAKLNLQSTQDLVATGMNVRLTAQQGLTAKGNASAELSASGQTTVKGAMVMIN